MRDDESEVLAANAAFYDAFTRRDARAMDELWASDAAVTCLHPGWEPLLGRDAVVQSWLGILRGGGAPAEIRCAHPHARVHGEAAWVVCAELVPGGALVATNVFVREGGRWRMAHHHASPLPAPVAPSESGGLPN